MHPVASDGVQSDTFPSPFVGPVPLFSPPCRASPPPPPFQWEVNFCNSNVTDSLVEEGSAVPISETPLIYAFPEAVVDMTVAVSAPTTPEKFRFYHVGVAWKC